MERCERGGGPQGGKKKEKEIEGRERERDKIREG